MKIRKKLVLFVLLLLAAQYVASYALISRRGYAEADQWKLAGFYYVTPENSDRWRFTNFGLVFFYWPINNIDQAIGLGRGPASEPLWGLSNVEKK